MKLILNSAVFVMLKKHWSIWRDVLSSKPNMFGIKPGWIFHSFYGGILMFVVRSLKVSILAKNLRNFQTEKNKLLTKISFTSSHPTNALPPNYINSEICAPVYPRDVTYHHSSLIENSVTTYKFKTRSKKWKEQLKRSADKTYK